MRFTVAASVVVGSLASSAMAGITVTSYQTIAQVNGYAPTSQAQYYQQQTLTNISPAAAHVSGDWMGTNAGGSTPTWHFVGSADATSATTFDANSLTVTASGSFAYELNTTAQFVDPASSNVYGPGAAANYEGLFASDVAATYSLSVQLNPRGRVRLNTLAGEVIFDRFNLSGSPVLLNLSGTLPPDQYRVLATTSLGAPNFPNGVNHFEASGSYENLTFTVQVPEPGVVVVTIAIAVTSGNPRRRKSRSLSI